MTILKCTGTHLLARGKGKAVFSPPKVKKNRHFKKKRLAKAEKYSKLSAPPGRWKALQGKILSGPPPEKRQVSSGNGKLVD